MDERIEVLMNDVLEGTADSADVVRLDALLAADPVLRRRFEELTRAHDLLLAAPRETAPAEIRRNVLASVRASVRPEAAREGWLTVLGRAFSRRPALGVGYAFAAGLAAGFLVYALVARPGVAPISGQLSGSMTPLASAGHTIESKDLSVAGGTVTLETRRTAAGTMLVITSDTADSVEIDLKVSAGGETRGAQGVLPGRTPRPSEVRRP